MGCAIASYNLCVVCQPATSIATPQVGAPAARGGASLELGCVQLDAVDGDGCGLGLDFVVAHSCCRLFDDAFAGDDVDGIAGANGDSEVEAGAGGWNGGAADCEAGSHDDDVGAFACVAGGCCRWMLNRSNNLDTNQQWAGSRRLNSVAAVAVAAADGGDL